MAVLAKLLHWNEKGENKAQPFSYRATLLTALEIFATDISNVTTETSQVRELLAMVSSEPNRDSAPLESLNLKKRLEELKKVQHKLKERLDIYYNWWSQLEENGQLKDSVFVPEIYHATVVRRQLQCLLAKWHALRCERKGLEAEMEARVIELE